MRVLSRLLVSAATAFFAVATTQAWAMPIHYLTGAGSADPTGPIAASGNTAVGLSDLTALDLAGVNVLWITNGNNGAPPSAVTNNLAALGAFVRNGGVLSYHDRYVSDGQFNMSAVLPGAGGMTFVRDFGNDSDIDILTFATSVTNGLTNASLDGGNSSSHGYVDAASLPAGGVGILNRGGAVDEIVDLYYPFGAGWVYYSTIPLDFYLAGGNDPPRTDMVNLYAVNEVGFQASLSNRVPEPTTAALVGLALLGLGLMRGRKQ